MRFRFITVLHFLELESYRNKGIRIFESARISNGKEILAETIGSDLMIETAGWHSNHEFENATYLYYDGEIEVDEDEEKANKSNSNFNFYCLRLVQRFIYSLWEVKDHSIYVRDGFLIVYDNDIENGFTYKSSVSAINSKASTEIEKTKFTDKEINLAIERFKLDEIIPFDEIDMSFKHTNESAFYKRSGSTRLDRAYSFLLLARSHSLLPMKIVLYSTALECLFISSKTEISHKVSERVSHFLEFNSEEKLKTYKLIKKAYDIRSTVIHGSAIKLKQEELVEFSIELDNILRRILIGDTSVFLLNENQLEEHFTYLLFGMES